MPTVAAVLVFVCTCMHPAAAPVSRCVCVAERLFAPSAFRSRRLLHM